VRSSSCIKVLGVHVAVAVHVTVKGFITSRLADSVLTPVPVLVLVLDGSIASWSRARRRKARSARGESKGSTPNTPVFSRPNRTEPIPIPVPTPVRVSGFRVRPSVGSRSAAGPHSSVPRGTCGIL
jgi:hypothetical protein